MVWGLLETLLPNAWLSRRAAMGDSVIVTARSWFASYQRAWIRPDVAAGITLAAYLLPSALGDSSLAGLPPEAGLYACLFGGLVFWLFCSSRQTAVTVTSAISLLVGASLAEIAAGDPVRHAALAACTAWLVAAIAFAAWAVRAGTIVNFFSETVLIGFKCGVALFLSSTQLPKLFGFSGGHGGDFWTRMAHFFHGLPDTNPASLTLGVIALALLLLGKTIFKGRPVALFVVIGGIVAARLLHLDERGVALLGNVPQGLPMPSLPAVAWADVHEILPLAMACFMLAAVETTAIGRMFAAKYNYRLDATQEFLALGAANLAAGFGGGFPVSGGMSQSLVNETGGARTPLSGLIAAVVTAIVVVFFTGLLSTLPQPVLAAVVLMAVTGLIQIDALRQIWRFSRTEFAVAIAALMGVLAAGLLQGVLIGVVISILLLIRRASRPRVAEVARVPGTSYFADRVRHPENPREPGVVVIRPEGAILYFNVDHVRDSLIAIMRAQAEAPRLVILFMGNVPHVDFAGAEFLAHLRDDFKAKGMGFGLAETHGEVREALQRLGDHQSAGLAEANQTVDDVLVQWKRTDSLT